MDGLIACVRPRLAELAKFGSVGALAFVVDLGVFNLLLLYFRTSPIIAKTVSVIIATLVAWLGSRFWTFANQRTSTVGRELLQFGVVNVIGLLIGVGILWISHYLFRFTSPIEDNISNLFGIGLGSIFRYFAYRNWVFTGKAA